MNRIFIAAVLLLNQISGFAQDAILWKISGNGIQNPSYIFGTIHAHCDFQKFLKPELTDAIASTDLIVLELNLTDFSTIVAINKSQMKEADRPVSSMLNANEYKSVDSACLAILGDSLKVFDNRSPMVLMSKLFLSESITACAPVPLDVVVAEFSQLYKKRVHGLESFGFQDSLLNSVSDSLQIVWLLDFCRNIKKAKDDFALLQSVYDEQKSEALYDATFKISPEMSVLKEDLLDKRNKKWFDFLQTNLTSNTLFMAVGAAHLGGEQGLLALLKNVGYTLTPITIKF